MNKVIVLYFLITSALFLTLRFVFLLLRGRHFPNFKPKEVSKVFFGLIGIGIATYSFFHYLMDHIRNGILAIFGFLFGSLFMLIGEAVTPALMRLLIFLTENF